MLPKYKFDPIYKSNKRVLEKKRKRKTKKWIYKAPNLVQRAKSFPPPFPPSLSYSEHSFNAAASLLAIEWFNLS